MIHKTDKTLIYVCEINIISSKINYDKKFYKRPAAQHPITSPCKLLGALPIFISIHPNMDPIMNVNNMFTGINHLQTYIHI